MHPQVTVTHIHIFNECQGLKMQLSVGQPLRVLDPHMQTLAADIDLGMLTLPLLTPLLIAFECLPFGRI